MKKTFLNVMLLVALVVGTFAISQEPVSNTWSRDYVWFTLNANIDSPTPYNGKVVSVISDSAAPELRIYDGYNAAWNEYPTSDTTETISGTWTFSGDVSLGNDEDDDVNIDGQLIRKVFRQDFDCDSLDVEEDFSAAVTTDAGMNRHMLNCGDPEVSHFHSRLDGAQATAFVVASGVLDIDNDGIDNEGTEIVVAPDPQVADWICDFGEACYFRVGFNIASISGTDNLQVGWRINGDYVDDQVIGTIDTYGAFYWNSTAGNCVIATGDDGTDATDEVTGCDLSDGEDIVVEVSFSATGDFAFRYAATEAALESASFVTETNVDGAVFATGEVMVPYIALLNAADADTELKIDFVEVGFVQ